MRLLKYTVYFFIFLFFFLLKNTSGYSFDFGIKTGLAYQTFAYNAESNSSEDSGFGLDTSLISFFLPHPRILLSTELGFSYFQPFIAGYAGFTAAFVIYPEYLPYIGINIKEQFYSNILNKSKIWNTSLYVTLGSKLLNIGNHSLWMVFDYLIYHILDQDFFSSQFDIELAYTYKF